MAEWAVVLVPFIRSCLDTNMFNSILIRVVGEELWDEYRKRRRHLLEELNENQKFCDRLSTIIMKHITEDN